MELNMAFFNKEIISEKTLLVKPSPYFLLFSAQYPWYNYWDFAHEKYKSIIK
jgi:hypothetical protein